MPVSSFRPVERRFFNAIGSLFVLIFLALILGLCTTTASSKTPTVTLETPNAVIVVNSDTLDASPEINAIVAAWNPTELRAYCVTSFAEWPGWVYLRHVSEAHTTACEGTVMGLAQLPECLSPQQLAEVPPMILIQCGPRVFQRNKDANETTNEPALPLIPGTRIA